MRILGRTGVPFVGIGLVLFAFSACDSNDTKRKKHHDDCSVDTDCDDDEYCDDGECARRSTSGGTGGLTGAPTGGTAGSSAGTSSSGGSGGSTAPSSDLTWCTDSCEGITCPGAQTGSACIESCLVALEDERSIGCSDEYQAFIDCGIDSGSCDQATLESVCANELMLYAECAVGG